jgi:hypothetical protein
VAIAFIVYGSDVSLQQQIAKYPIDFYEYMADGPLINPKMAI